MAMARKCDRCGALYEQYSTKVKEAVGLSGINGFAFMKRKDGGSNYFIEDQPRDLCPDCSESLLAWFKREEEKPNPWECQGNIGG